MSHQHDWHRTGTLSGSPDHPFYHHHCPTCDALGVSQAEDEIPDRVSPWREHYLGNARKTCSECRKQQIEQNHGGT